MINGSIKLHVKHETCCVVSRGDILQLLTHYQTTNFRLFQTERVCRRQFQI